MYDIIIIGAGPVGSFAAYRLARLRYSVKIFEAKRIIGEPKQCAEGVPVSIFRKVGIEMQDDWIYKTHVHGLIVARSRKRRVSLKKRPYLVIDRKKFDKYLAKLAKDAGADFEHKRASDVSVRKNRVIVEGSKARMLIIATGADARLSRKFGIVKADKSRDVMNCFQYEMENLNIDDAMTFLYGKKIAPYGYAWIFPKSKTRANVGLGISSESGNPKHYLDAFIGQNRWMFKDAKVIEANAGIVPLSVGSCLRKGNVFAVGDAARVVNPLHGGGLETGLISAKFVVDAISKGTDCNYLWKRTFLSKHKRLYRLRHIINFLGDGFVSHILSLGAKRLEKLYYGKK